MRFIWFKSTLALARALERLDAPECRGEMDTEAKETTTKYAGLSALGLVGLVSIRRKFLTVG